MSTPLNDSGTTLWIIIGEQASGKTLIANGIAAQLRSARSEVWVYEGAEKIPDRFWHRSLSLGAAHVIVTVGTDIKDFEGRVLQLIRKFDSKFTRVIDISVGKASELLAVELGTVVVSKEPVS